MNSVTRCHNNHNSKIKRDFSTFDCLKYFDDVFHIYANPIHGVHLVWKLSSNKWLSLIYIYMYLDISFTFNFNAYHIKSLICVSLFGPFLVRQNCITPENYYGRCVALSYCPQVVNVFQQTDRNTAENYIFRLQRSCGTRSVNGDPLVELIFLPFFRIPYA